LRINLSPEEANVGLPGASILVISRRINYSSFSLGFRYKPLFLLRIIGKPKWRRSAGHGLISQVVGGADSDLQVGEFAQWLAEKSLLALKGQRRVVRGTTVRALCPMSLLLDRMISRCIIRDQVASRPRAIFQKNGRPVFAVMNLE
jgi:hypothetical protein